LVIAGAVALVIVVIAAIDFRGVVSEVPDLPAPCAGQTYTSICEQERSAAFEERLDRAFELEDEFETRLWIYALAALGAVLAGAGVVLTRTAGERRRELFTDLGVAGVLWMLIGFALNLIASDGLVDLPPQPVFYPGVALLVVAGVGTLATRRPPPDAEREHIVPRRFERAVLIAGGASAGLALLAAAVILVGREDPCAFGPDQWVDDLVGPGLVLAGAGIVCGLVALTQRHWFAAVLMLGPAPFAMLVAGLSTVCWN
jgi:hypothetical protein